MCLVRLGAASFPLSSSLSPIANHLNDDPRHLHLNSPPADFSYDKPTSTPSTSQSVLLSEVPLTPSPAPSSSPTPPPDGRTETTDQSFTTPLPPIKYIRFLSTPFDVTLHILSPSSNPGSRKALLKVSLTPPSPPPPSPFLPSPFSRLIHIFLFSPLLFLHSSLSSLPLLSPTGAHCGNYLSHLRETRFSFPLLRRNWRNTSKEWGEEWREEVGFVDGVPVVSQGSLLSPLPLHLNVRPFPSSFTIRHQRHLTSS